MSDCDYIVRGDAGEGGYEVWDRPMLRRLSQVPMDHDDAVILAERLNQLSHLRRPEIRPKNDGAPT